MAKRIGFEAGNSFEIDKLDPSVREALANVPKDAQKLMAGLGRGAIGEIGMVLTISDHITRSERNLVITITSGMGSLADNTSGGSIAYRSSKAVGAVRTGLREKLNHSPPYRNGNWKIASRDRRPPA